MSELRAQFEEMATRGEERGADAVVAASVAEAERRATAATSTPRRGRISAAIALAAVVVLALIVGALALRAHDRASRPRVGATAGTPGTGAPPTTSAPSAPTSTLPGPTIDFAAGDFGRVAWIDGRGLVTASSAHPEGRLVAQGQIERPAFSSDGRWIAFVRDGSLNVMPSDGGDATDLDASGRHFEWSPTGDQLAWVAGTDFELRITDPGSDHTVTIDGTVDVFDFAWAPDGRSLAVSREARGAPVTGFEVVDVDGSNVRTIDFEPATRDYGAGNVNPLLFAGWQPDSTGVLVWIDEGGSGSIMQDGLELWLVPLDGSTAHDLGRTLVKRQWVRWSPNGSRVAIVRSSGREVVDSPRTVTVCTTYGVCSPISGDDTATLDPAWSPDGRQLAFVSHPAIERYPEMLGNAPDWHEPYAARRLWIANADGSDAHQVDNAGDGVASPRWTADGQRILYVRDDALWTLDLTEGSTKEVLAPIAPVPKYVAGTEHQSNLAPPDAVYEPTDANNLPAWESLVTWVP